jgi:hypothetical protein
MPAPATVWFNKNLSSIYQVIEILHREQRPNELRVLCSHTNIDCPALDVADISELEPRGLSERDYLTYCLDIIARHQVEVFIPGKYLSSIVRERARFESVGAKVVAAADAPTLKLLNNKAKTYAALHEASDGTGTGLRLPEYRRVQSLAEFDAAYADLRDRHPRLCFKPTESMFGLGFRIVSESGGSLQRLLSGDPLKIDLQEARRCFAESPTFQELLVMQYLPGVERSVDCLAKEGELIRCVIRRKPESSERGQLIECNPAVERDVRTITRHLRLSGLFNVQFKDVDDQPYLLEINPRMSGGIAMACLSGVALPLWAIRLELGTATPDEIPQAVCGQHVKEVGRAVLLTRNSDAR